jgi:hypothetical protein
MLPYFIVYQAVTEASLIPLKRKACGKSLLDANNIANRPLSDGVSRYVSVKECFNRGKCGWMLCNREGIVIRRYHSRGWGRGDGDGQRKIHESHNPAADSGCSNQLFGR